MYVGEIVRKTYTQFGSRSTENEREREREREREKEMREGY